MDPTLLKTARADILAKLDSLNDVVTAIDRVIGLFEVHGTEPVPVLLEKESPLSGTWVRKLKSVAVDPKTRTEKACNKCHVVKPLAEYPKNHTCADGHTGECKECCRKRARASWRKHHGKPEVGPSADPEATITCKLCNAVCHGHAKYKSHMRSVHSMVAA